MGVKTAILPGIANHADVLVAADVLLAFCASVRSVVDDVEDVVDVGALSGCEQPANTTQIAVASAILNRVGANGAPSGLVSRCYRSASAL